LIYFVYSLMLVAGLLLSLPYWLYQILRHGKYRTGFFERMGRVPSRLLHPDSPSSKSIWVHAVSVGEVLAVSSLIEQLHTIFPHRRVVVSTTTDTGQVLARKRFGEENVLYFPIDFAFAIRPYLQALRPELIVLAETEFWPNFLRLAYAHGARVAVVNARISDRSWPRYRRFRWALGNMLAHIDLFLAQTQQDRDRLLSIGAAQERVHIVGNLKFDTSPPLVPAIVEKLRASLAADDAGPVLVCGSTVEDEEPPLLKAFENVLVEHPRAVMILAPRHPERFREIAHLLKQMGLPFFLRSEWSGESLAGSVLLLDSMGELASLYALADVAFVGGSLVPRGGHNIIEPAQHGVAIIVGNYTENFRDIVSLFYSRDGLRVATLAEFPLTLMQLLGNDDERRALGRRAQEAMRLQMGATSRTLDALKLLLAQNPTSPPVAVKADHKH
jgi:3-deoxy-D-manno-octulosonic-acid transferase